MCGTASWWAKLALVCMAVATPLHIGGWASNNWMTYESNSANLEVDVGLWRQKNCTSNNCKNSAVASKYETDVMDAVRGLETIVLCMAIVITVLLAIYVFAEGARVFNFAVLLIVLCFVAGVMSVAGMIVWMVNVPSPFVASFSMGLTVLAYLLILIAGTLLIPDVLEPEEPYRNTRAISPYTPRDRRNMVTPLSYRGGAYHNGYRW